MVRRLFTPVQANRTLPLVRRIVADILARGQELSGLARPAASSRAGAVDAAGRTRIGELQREVQTLIAELEALGCSYKDWSFETGLVDFPSKVGGERVLLCWRSDEDSVQHYHGYEDGFAGRRPIPAHLLDESNEQAASDATA